ncbi:DUF6454 family protein [Pseudalkalibacillus hwajinpoensis]|uniref:WG repeat-containing protein n=1 Tax=Guptibacillus hwajinpoensis TaxID=208199 RepID=A0A4U1MJU2_9BACL|nr:DUF6454 family protein [Pseudalkalibacillus hwajinpoensis]TKD70786.1 hypothetical protein FBF83_09235 [Pseudalkalibacillus hwajinpoensis]
MRKIILVMTGVLLISMFTTVFAENNENHDVTESFKELSRSTNWDKKDQVNLQFDAYHPQGMTQVGDKFYMSSVEIIEKPKKYSNAQNGYDRSAGKGIGHLFVFSKQGELLKDIKLGEGDMYHPGGIDFDGKNIWVPTAEYRPDSKSIVYKINTETLEVEEAFRVNDHIGGVVHNDKNGKILGVSWGSRKYYVWGKKGNGLKMENNQSHFIDYQDCEYVGQDKMICSGISELDDPNSNTGKYELGGLALLDTKTFNIEHEVPVAEFSSEGHVITRNPVFLKKSDNGIKLFAIPDDDEQASLMIYEAKN